MRRLPGKFMSWLRLCASRAPQDAASPVQPTVARRRDVPRSPGGCFILLAAFTAALIANPARADPWYQHYAKAEEALAEQEWTVAVREANAALAKKADSGARVRSYGMNVTPYFPYLKLGIAYYNLGQLDAALQAFETEASIGAIVESDADNADLKRYRSLVVEAQARASEEKEQRIRQIVEQRLVDARALENRGLLGEAVAALDEALAVAPDNVEARTAMSELRRRLAARESERELEARVSELVRDGRSLLDEGRYDEAASAFRQALSLRPGANVQELLTAAERGLRAKLDADPVTQGQAAKIRAGLDEVAALEAAGRLDAALNRLQSVLVLDPASVDARSVQIRLLQARNEADAQRRQESAIGRLLAEAGARLEAGSAEEALSAANRVLALDPGNGAALDYVARAYAVVSRKLLGTAQKSNIPPAVRFVDSRLERDDGTFAQTVRVPDFRLAGVIIDDSPVKVVSYDGDRELETGLTSQPLGEFYVTEFNVAATLSPGLSTLRLVATDSEDLVSSSEYAVFYARPFFRTPWFYAVLSAAVLALGVALLWRRQHHRRQLTRRRYNPYVAGAPVFGDDQFFGRRDLVDRILQTIHNNSLLLHGERRIGKTSLLHHLRKRLRELDDPRYVFYPVYVDLQGTAEARFFRTMSEDIFQELAPMLGNLKSCKDVTEEYSDRDFLRDIHAVLKCLKKQTARTVKLVLLIDEVDELNDYDPRINQKLRSLFMKSFAESLVAVVCGVQIKKQWEREGSPWYNFFEELEVKPFGPVEARELIERPIRGIFRLDEGVVERIICLTAGRPYLIQKVCMSLVTRVHEKGRGRITIADVEAVSRPAVAREPSAVRGAVS